MRLSRCGRRVEIGVEGWFVNILMTLGLAILFLVIILGVGVPMLVKRNKREPEAQRMWADPGARR